MTHPKGRQPIGVNQPPYGGTNYPFVDPSSDVQYLLGDLYLSYEDDNCEFAHPFKVSRLYGFDDAGTPGPTNNHDIVIEDANGETVFDSTDSLEYAARTWAGRLLIIEWITRATFDSSGDRVPTTGSAVCRVTRHTEWSPEDTAPDYSADFSPSNGELDARTCNKMPRRVRSILVGTTRIEGEHLQLLSGNNVALTADTDTIISTGIDTSNLGILASGSRRDGARFVNPVTMTAKPGDGLGRATACESVEPIVRLINGVGPDACGNVAVDLGGCYRAQPPVLRGPATLYSVPMEEDEADYYHSSFTEDIQENSAASLQFTNRCGACCDCDYFVRTYAGLDRQWDRWADMASRSEDVRDLYRLNIDRWNAQKECREGNPLRLVMIPEAQCRVAVGATYCNVTGCCLTPLQLRLTFEVFDQAGNPAEIDFATVICNQTTITGSEHSDRMKYELAGEWPVYDIYYDFADARDVSSVSLRLCIPNCSGYSIKATLTAHASSPPDCDNLPLTLVSVPDEVTTLWDDVPYEQTLALTNRVVPMDSRGRTDDVCECPPFTSPRI